MPDISSPASLFLLFLTTPVNAQLKQEIPQQVKLSNGWCLSPAENQIPVGDLSLPIAVSPDLHYAALDSDSGNEE